MSKSKINIAITGVGNCASALLQDRDVQGISGKHHWTDRLLPRWVTRLLMSNAGAAFDVDKRKVGKSLPKRQVFAKPNFTKVFYDKLPDYPVKGRDGAGSGLGISEHMADYYQDKSFVVTDQEPCDVVKVLKGKRS